MCTKKFMDGISHAKQRNQCSSGSRIQGFTASKGNIITHDEEYNDGQGMEEPISVTNKNKQENE